MSRGEIARRLKRLCDRKLLADNPRRVLELGEEAYASAKSGEVDEPWTRVAAYRLAHLLFREERPSQETLQRILQLFQEAAGPDPRNPHDPIGPLPLLYQIPVYSRLAELQPERRSELDELKSQLFVHAVNRYQYFGQQGHGDYAILEQAQNFNMLELAAYFTGQDYSKLRGLGSTHRDLDGSWCLLSNRIHLTDVRYGQGFARVELDSILERHSDALAFRQVGTNGRWEWQAGQSGWRSWGADDRARTLAMGIVHSNEEAPQIAVRLESTPGAVRKAKSKLIGHLKKELPSRNLGELTWENLVSGSGELPIFMAIESRWLNGPAGRR